MKQPKLTALVLGIALASTAIAADKNQQEPQKPSSETQHITINGVGFDVSKDYQFFTWDNLPEDLILERQPLKVFTNTDGETHYYEVVYNKNGNLNWYQAAKLAEEAGGYLASVTSQGENDFLYNLISDPKYYYQFPKYVEGKSRANHYEVMIGPMLGGYQPADAEEPLGDWRWLSGEKWAYSNWVKNLDDGVFDKDPRPNTQPNDSNGGQDVMGFGELNLPVSTWGDYTDSAGTYGFRSPKRMGFIIEYNPQPK